MCVSVSVCIYYFFFFNFETRLYLVKWTKQALNSVSSYFSSSGRTEVTGLHSLTSHLPGKGLGTGSLDGALAKAFFSLLLTALPH